MWKKLAAGLLVLVVLAGAGFYANKKMKGLRVRLILDKNDEQLLGARYNLAELAKKLGEQFGQDPDLKVVGKAKKLLNKIDHKSCVGLVRFERLVREQERKVRPLYWLPTSDAGAPSHVLVVSDKATPEFMEKLQSVLPADVVRNRKVKTPFGPDQVVQMQAELAQMDPGSADSDAE